MRMALGLVSLLVTIGVIVLILSSFYLPYAQTAITARKSVEPQLELITLQGARDGVKTAPRFSDGRLTGLTVTAIAVDGMLDRYYGLRPADIIIEIGPFPVKETDEELAEALLLESPRSRHTLIILRNGQKLALPPAENPRPPAQQTVAAPAPAPTPPANPGVTGSAESDDRLQKQIQVLQKIPGLR